jgi:hypothetical protein
MPQTTGKHYVTRRSNWMQKHKSGITCPVRFVWNLHRSHLSMKNSVSTFAAQTHWNSLLDLVIAIIWLNQKVGHKQDGPRR